MRTAARMLLLPLRGLRAGGGVVTAVVDGSEVSRSPGAVAIRRVLAALFIGYAIVLSVESLRQGMLPSVLHLVIAMFGCALLGNFSARFIRDWTLVFAGVFAYVLTARYALNLKLSIYYAPQLD